MKKTIETKVPFFARRTPEQVVDINDLANVTGGAREHVRKHSAEQDQKQG